MQRVMSYLVVIFISLVSVNSQAQEPSGRHKTATNKAAKQNQQPAAPEVLPDPPTPAVQVKGVGLPQCVDTMTTMSRAALDHKYDVQSAWYRAAPADHVFQSVAIVSNPQLKPSDSLAALVAAPTAKGGCDGVAMQVVPLNNDCAAIEKAMVSKGNKVIPMMNTKVLFDSTGKRYFLLQGYKKTCVAIAVDSTFGNLPPG